MLNIYTSVLTQKQQLKAEKHSSKEELCFELRAREKVTSAARAASFPRIFSACAVCGRSAARIGGVARLEGARRESENRAILTVSLISCLATKPREDRKRPIRAAELQKGIERAKIYWIAR